MKKFSRSKNTKCENESNGAHMNFQDAEEDLSPSVATATEVMPLPEAILDTTISLDLFMNNKFEDAKQRLEPLACKSIYHALGYGTIMYLQAAMTLEAADIEKAIEITKRSTDVCHQFRRKGLGAALARPTQTKKTLYNEFSDEQCHAELCYAECLLERAFLMFVQDENIMGMIKGGLKIRECYRSYRECWKMMQYHTWKDERLKEQFDCGARMGVGAFNLMLSLLPPKILKLLEFVGFSGNKMFGLQQLELATEQQNSIRAPLCALLLLSYHTFVTHILGLGEGQIEKARTLLAPCLVKYPAGALFLFFNGRINLIGGNIDQAIVNYEQSIDCQTEWKQFHHICYWELMWCYCYKGDWLFAMKYAERLSKESRWSKATYLYQKGCFMYMSEDQSDDTRKHMNSLFEQVPKLIQRFAGKSIPIEKFALRKSNRYLEQKGLLTLPAYELIYVWNGFTIIGKNPNLLNNALAHIETATNEILANKDRYINYMDDYCMTLLLKGVALKHRGQAFQAKMCFQEILENLKNLTNDIYLLPWCEMELALVAFEEGDLEESRKQLDRAKEYKGYALESRLHFRMHALSHAIRTHVPSDDKPKKNQSFTDLPSWGDEDPIPSEFAETSDAASK